MKKGTLTIETLEKVYQEAKAYGIERDDYVIKKWKEPFLWFLWLFKGYTYTSENWKMYWVDFRGVRYMIKSKEL